MRTLISLWIYRAFRDHCEGLHNADFEVCPHLRCRLAWHVEWLLFGWLYGEEFEDEQP